MTSAHPSLDLKSPTRFNLTFLLKRLLVASSGVLIYVALDRSTLALQILSNISAWYPPAALTLAVILGLGSGYLPVLMIAACICISLNYTLINVFWNDVSGILGIAIYGWVAWGLRRVIGLDWRLRRLRDVLWFTLVFIPAAFAVAAMAVEILTVTGEVLPGMYGRAVLAWAVGDAAAFLSITPFLINFILPPLRRYLGMESPDADNGAAGKGPRLTALGYLEVLGQTLAIPLTLWIAFGFSTHPVYVCFIPVIWVAVRHGLRATTLTLVMLNTGAIVAFQLLHPVGQRLTDLQFFMLALSVTGLLLGALIEERKVAESSLREAEARFRVLVEQSLVGIYTLEGPQLRLTYINPRGAEIFGYAPSEIIGVPALDFAIEADRPLMAENIRKRLQGEMSSIRYVYRGQHRSGNVLDIEVQGIRSDLDGKPAILGVLMDITESKRAEDTLRRSEERLRQAVRISNIGIFDHDYETGSLYWSTELRQIFGHSLDGPVTLQGYLDSIHPADRDSVGQAMERALDPAGGGLFAVEHRIVRGDGEIRWLIVRSQTFFSQHRDGVKRTRAIGAVLDTTERRRAEQALREAEEKYRDIFDHAVHGIFQSTPAGRYLSANRALARMFNYDSPEEMIASITDIGTQIYVDPSRRSEFIARLGKDGVVHDFVVEVYRKDKSRAWGLVNARVVRNAQGEISHYEGTQQDITARKTLEAQYEQAQKMEVVGRLAGGIAHDFNNLLGVILGYTELSNHVLGDQHPLYRNLSQIRQAAERGANLTRQLLTFSRQQVAYPRVINLNDLIANLSDILTRMVGEDVSIEFIPNARFSLIQADPVQVEQILMNLGVNARDAMPGGGKIVIETSNVDFERTEGTDPATVPSGAHVMMSFSDTGCGIDPKILPSIFEPFFTTKSPGTGTGLGLATVYGMVKQNRGHLWAYSEPEHGATFKICFPKADEEAEVLPITEVETVSGSGDETILLVEDEAGLREVAATLLESGGYRVLQAANAKSALAVSQEFAGPIQLLLTDVIMPGMRGTELCAVLEKARPGIRTLYISGYAGDQIGQGEPFPRGAAFLEKPFTKKSLLQKVRIILDT